MNRVLRATLFLTVCAAAFGKPWGIHGPMKQSAGEQSWCKEDKTYRLRYNITAINDDQVLEIEQLTDIEDVSCDIDHTQLQLKFHNEIISNKYALQWKLGGYFLTGGDKYNCAAKAKPGTDMLLRRVVAAQDDGQYVMVHTAPARYDDIYEQADIDFLAEKGGGDCDGSKHICIGLNTDDTCESSAGPIPIYSNQFITLTCSDCFIAFEADVFFSMSIKHWELQSLTGGFRNGAVHGSIELDLLAQASWSTGIDKTMSLLTHADLVSFHVGPVPFEIWFDSPVELVANVMLHASAEAKAGVAMNWTIGESSISWDPKNHWQHVKPNPSVTFTPTISGSAEFDGSASLALIPGINMHVNDVFRYGLTLNPHLDMQINGDTTSKQICESVTYDVDFTSEAELDINIDWLHIHNDKIWGPTLIWTSGTQNISQACVPA